MAPRLFGNTPSVGPVATQASYNEQAMLDAGHAEILLRGIYGDGVVTGGVVTAQGSPNGTVAVTAVTSRQGTSYKTAPANAALAVTNGHATLARTDLICHDMLSNTVVVVAGTAAANAPWPAPTATQVALAAIHRPAAATTVTTAMITDVRALAMPTPSGTTVLYAANYGTLVDADAGTNATTNTTTIQAALDAAEALSARSPINGAGSPSGAAIVQLPVGVYQINGISVGKSTILRGVGQGTVLKLANSVSTTGSPKSVVTFKDSTNFAGITDLRIDGNKANQTDTGLASHGIDATRNNVSDFTDGGLFIERVFVNNCKGDGIKATGTANTLRVRDSYLYANSAHGFEGKSDQFLANVTAYQNARHGFTWASANGIIVEGCRSIDNGSENRATYGEFIWTSCSAVTVHNCQAKNISLFGFNFTTCTSVSVVGCGVFRAASTFNTNCGAFHVLDSTANLQLRSCWADGAGGAGSLKYGLVTRALGAGCSFDIKTNSLATGRVTSLSGAGVETAECIFDNVRGAQVGTYAATFTPNHYLGGVIFLTLTGNVTVANQSQTPVKGEQITFVFTQDATGGRTTSWGTNYSIGSWTPNTAANKVNSITFVWDGTKWRQISGTVGA